MTYEAGEAGRVKLDASDFGTDGFWTFAAVEERLIEAMRLWWRSPGGGRWPFAADAPWHLMTRKTRIAEGGFKGRDLQLRMQAEDAEEAKRMEGRGRRGALSREEVAERDQAGEWLAWVPARDRRLVVAVLGRRAAGVKRIEWARIRAELGASGAVGADGPDGVPEHKGLYRRYTRAIAGIAARLNGR